MAAVGEAILQTQHTLEGVGIPDARLEAELLLAVVLGMARPLLFAYPEQQLTPQQEDQLARLLARRLKREPLAYILGHREFYGIDLAVGPGVIVPRPETELLVQQALLLAQDHTDQGRLVIGEPGTGCGALAIGLAVHMPMAKIYATDLSPEALEIAQANVNRVGVAETVTLLQGDLLEPLEEMVDVIVANLPYVPSGRIPDLQPEIHWEPKAALDGGPDGLDVIRRLLSQAQRKLKGGGAIILEIDPGQVGELERLAAELFPAASMAVTQDLAHQDRVFTLR